MSDLRPGILVRVRAYGNNVILRRCAGVQGNTVLICNDAEYKAALLEQRKPICVGFPIEDVIESIFDSACERKQIDQ